MTSEATAAAPGRFRIPTGAISFPDTLSEASTPCITITFGLDFAEDFAESVLERDRSAAPPALLMR
jgi:hypothetical protein